MMILDLLAGEDDTKTMITNMIILYGFERPVINYHMD